MTIDPAEATRAALAICGELGFAEAGAAEATPSRWGAELRTWLAAGKHGSMEYLARHVEERLDPARILPGARSVVMVMDVYAGRARTPPGSPSAPVEGRIARYAQGRDYHTVMKKRLHALADKLREVFPNAACRAFVDTAPVLEREHAARAGLGWVGKHTLLIHPRRGSYVLLGGVLTTIAMDPGTPEADHCGTCTRCIEACPTGAITPYSVDASRCISYLTIERREAIPPEFHGPIGPWLFGCDICQEVCPHNSPRDGRPDDRRPEYDPRRTGLRPLDVLGWTEEDRRREFSGSAMKRATLAMMKRNALIVAANLAPASVELRRRALAIDADESEPAMVRETARMILERLGPGAV